MSYNNKESLVMQLVVKTYIFIPKPVSAKYIISAERCYLALIVVIFLSYFIKSFTVLSLFNCSINFNFYIFYNTIFMSDFYFDIYFILISIN